MERINEKLVEVLKPLKEYFRGIKVATIGQVETFATRYNLHPQLVTYLLQVVMGRDVCERIQRKYGSWVSKEKFLKEAYVKGMEVEIYDECSGVKYEGIIEDVSPASIKLKTKEGKEVEISKGCIPEWGLIYIMEEAK
jgi:hypothetical protein